MNLGKTSTQQYNKARKEELKGDIQTTGDSVAQKAHTAAANVKEGLGFDGTEQRAKAAEKGLEKHAHQMEADVKQAAHNAAGKMSEVTGN